MEGPAFWAAAILAAVLVGMAKGGIPVIGMLAVPIMALFVSPVVAAGVLLPVYVVSDLFGLYAYRHAYDRRVLALILPGAVLGVGLGWATAHVVPEPAVTLIIGLIGLVFALNMLLRRPAGGPARPARPGAGLFWGVLTGFTSFVSHSGAPPYQVYVLPLRLEKAVFAGTGTIAFAIINAVKLVPYWFLGQLGAQNLHVSVLLALPAVVAVFLGVWLVNRLPARLFFRLVTWSLALVSAKLVYDGLTGLWS